MLKQLVVALATTTLFASALACGGGTDPANVPDGVGDQDPANNADGAEAGGKKDSIVRDADGDGVPDDEEKSPCADKTETQCKINMNCAWSDEGKCVKS